ALMKTLTGSLLVLLAATPLALADEKTRLEKVTALVAALAKKDFAAASKDFDQAMQKAMPKDKCESFWKTLTGQVGELKKTTRTRTESLKMYEVVYVTCAFARMELDFRVVFDKDDRVTGLQVRPAQAAKFDPPPYAPAGSYREEKVTVGEKSD